MNPLSVKMKALIFDASANFGAWFGFITTWRVDLDYWIRITAGLGAVAVSIVTIYYKIKKNGKDS